MERLNVLLIVWDACRLDVAREYAPNLATLAEENLWFENAITPGGQSLSSHVSMFTGEYPHEHGIYRQTDYIDATLPLLEELGDRGYDRYAVSANGFAAPRYGFDRGFDEFHNTQGMMAYPDGLDLHEYAREVREETGRTFSVDDVDRVDLLRHAFSHPHSTKSLLNIAAAAVSELTGRYEFLQHIPHPRFNKYNEFCYRPEQNTRIIRRLLEESANASEPLFLFANYMDPHHPYAPPKRYQEEFCGRTFSYRELSELSELTHPWNFLERVETEGGLGAGTLQTVRDLYKSEVRTADEHLGRVLNQLERTEMRDETLIIVCADHGENLGETNQMGERHMGHVRSASEHHLKVPLVVAHPDVRGRIIEEFVSIKDIYSLITDGMERLIASNGSNIKPYLSSNGVVSAEIPPTTTTALVEKYPELREILTRHLSVTYYEDWKVVLSSTGKDYAWKGGDECALDVAPSEMVEQCRKHLRAMVTREEVDGKLSRSERSQLEALGYL